jgi:dipeptidyl aminopeptidase/acylaminoacyl peptidase
MIRIVTAALALTVSATALAQSAPAQNPASAVKRTAEDFAALPVLEDPALSPDGNLIAAKIASNGTQYFAIIPVAGGQPQFAQTQGDVNWWRWVNNEWLVLGIGGVMPSRWGDMYMRQAVSINTQGKVVRLLPRDVAQNGDNVIWTARDGSPRILLGAQKSFYGEDLDFWMNVNEVNVATGRNKLVLSPREGVLSWYADGQGVVRMGVGYSLDGRNVRVLYRDGENKEFHEIVKQRSSADMIIPRAFLAGGKKAITIADDEGGFSAVYEYDLEKLERGAKLYSSKGYDIGGVILTRDRSTIAGVSFTENEDNVLWLDPELKKLNQEAADKVKGARAALVSYSDDLSRAIVFVGASDAAGAYFLYDRKSGGFNRLAFRNPALKLAKLNPVKTIRYKARDGVEIAAILTLPKKGGKNLPLIVMPHGGPFARDDESWDWWTQFLAERGYAVVQPNYRGSSGYGTAFTKLGAGQWGLKMQDDLNDAITYLAAQGIADPKRACMVGASYGGYAALRAAQRDGKLYRCAISYAGVSDLQAMRKYDRGFLASGARSDWLKEQAPDFKSVSPLNMPQDFSIPVLIVHGKKDETVPVKQSREMADKLKKANKKVTYIEQPEGDHHFTRGEDRLQFLKAMEAFLAEHNPA